MPHSISPYLALYRWYSTTQEVYDTGTHRETELFTNGQYVFDGAEYTNWTSDCRVSLGGCPARTVSVGADITGLAAGPGRGLGEGSSTKWVVR